MRVGAERDPGGSVRRRAPPWRSVLYVPTHVEKFVLTAHTRGADCIQLDLEDSVPAEQKLTARAMAGPAAARLKRLGCDVSVRINGGFRQAVLDIDAVVSPDVSALSIPKVNNAEHVRLLDELVSERERELGIEDRRTGFILIVETCRAYFNMDAIAEASDRVMAIMLGAEDLALEAGFEPAEDTLLMPKQQLVLAAAAAGVAPFGLLASPAAFGVDTTAFAEMARRSCRFGFVGSTCIHPAQVPVLNEAFSPTDEELHHARQLVELDERARREGRGSFALDGRMVDAPIVQRARRLLARRADLDEMASRRRGTTAAPR